MGLAGWYNTSSRVDSIHCYWWAARHKIINNPVNQSVSSLFMGPRARGAFSTLRWANNWPAEIWRWAASIPNLTLRHNSISAAVHGREWEKKSCQTVDRGISAREGWRSRTPVKSRLSNVETRRGRQRRSKHKENLFLGELGSGSPRADWQTRGNTLNYFLRKCN